MKKAESFKSAAEKAKPILEMPGYFSLEPPIRLIHFAGAASEIWLADIVDFGKKQVHICNIEGKAADIWDDAGDFNLAS